MKLIICPKCSDVVALKTWRKKCKCGFVSGRYLFDHRTALVSPEAEAIGLPNSKMSPVISFIIRDKDTKRPDIDFVGQILEEWKSWEDHLTNIIEIRE